MLDKFRRLLPLTRRAYCQTLLSPTGTKYVLPDLALFCGAADPAPDDGNSFIQGRFQGRRDAWLHIQQMLNLSDEDLFALYAGKPILKETSNG